MTPNVPQKPDAYRQAKKQNPNDMMFRRSFFEMPANCQPWHRQRVHLNTAQFEYKGRRSRVAAIHQAREL